jgi:hypothetical protein
MLRRKFTVIATHAAKREGASIYKKSMLMVDTNMAFTLCGHSRAK